MPKFDIYMLWGKDCNGNILRYYGSTQNLIKRKYNHKRDYNLWVKAGRPNKNKCSSVCIIDNGDWRMDKIDEVIGERWEAQKKEAEYIKNNECVNVSIPLRTKKEYYNDKKVILAEKHKLYYNDNRNEIKEKITCECGAEVTKYKIPRHRKTKKHINLLSNNESNM